MRLTLATSRSLPATRTQRRGSDRLLVHRLITHLAGVQLRHGRLLHEGLARHLQPATMIEDKSRSQAYLTHHYESKPAAPPTDSHQTRHQAAWPPRFRHYTPRCVVHHQPGRFNIYRRLRVLELHPLEITDRGPELLALEQVRHGGLHCSLRNTQHLGCVCGGDAWISASQAMRVAHCATRGKGQLGGRLRSSVSSDGGGADHVFNTMHGQPVAETNCLTHRRCLSAPRSVFRSRFCIPCRPAAAAERSERVSRVSGPVRTGKSKCANKCRLGIITTAMKYHG